MNDSNSEKLTDKPMRPMSTVFAVAMEMEKNTSVPHTVRFEYDPSKLAVLAKAVCNESGAVLHELVVRVYQ